MDSAAGRLVQHPDLGIGQDGATFEPCTPNPPTNIIPTKIARLELSGRFPRGMRIPPLNIKMMLDSSPRKSIMLVRRLAVS